jgi:hypothetical protein
VGTTLPQPCGPPNIPIALTPPWAGMLAGLSH